MNSPLKLSAHVEDWALAIPFRITGYTWNSYKVNIVEISDGKHVGRGESTPVHNLQETADSAYTQIEEAAARIERGIDREALLTVMAPGSARNAVDCALWDLEAKRTGSSVWELAGIRPKPLKTAYTIGIEDTPEAMAERARVAAAYPTLKIKVDADRSVERVAAIRAMRPEARLTVDANQGWTFEQLREVAPRLAALDVKLIEQPLPRGSDEPLEGWHSPVPLCADESCQHRGELAAVVRRYQIVNVKLDKAGGLTESLLLARAIRQENRQLLVSCMGGTSLAMAAGFVVGQLADYVELDGHMLFKRDRPFALHYHEGVLDVPDPRLWG